MRPLAVLVATLVVAASAHAEVAPVNESWDRQLADSLARSLTGGRLWFALLAAWVGGLLTSLTPCVYPLIPITVRYFGGMTESGRGRVIRLALVYVMGMVILYASLGTAFAATGTVFGSLLASPWVVGALAVLCAAMGASILGLFTLQLPPLLSTYLSTKVGGQHSGGAFAMGLTSGLVAAPCTGPVLAVILALIAKTGAIVVGFWLMVAFALGLGVPFLGLAIFSSSLQRLPAGGTWMEAVKTILATAMFVVAIYFLQLAWPGLREMVHAIPIGDLTGLILIVAGLVAGVFFLRSEAGIKPFLHGATILLVTLGISLAWIGSEAAPLIAWVTEHERGLARAREKGKPVMIDFTADWCAACKELDRHTYVDKRVRAEARRFVSMKLDATEVDDAMEALWDKYGVLGLPTVVFIDSQGLILDQPRVTGFLPAEELLLLMAQVH